MKYISVCSGIEAATVAWHPLGFEPLFFSEIDTFPSAVLAHHYPGVPNVGDLTRFAEWPDASPDIVVGGTPCQAFSIAGFRQGMADPRGNLALTYLAMVDRYRPRWVVWENVPGVLSSTGGRDFGSFLGALAKLGYGFAYRVLDAQFFGLAQRRRRVFVVAHLGDWRRAAAVLIEPQGLSGNPPPSREPRQTAPTIPSRRSAGGGLGTDFDCDGGLIASTGDIAHCLNAGGMGRIDYETETLITAFQESQSGFRAGDTHATLDSNNGSRRHNGAIIGTRVRRLTPLECERLQGFPDDYTLIPYGKTGKPSKDGPRYKALGNSMAVPVMRWIGKRIALQSLPQ